MTSSEDPGDPSDWPDGLVEIREIDKLLRCPICYDYMKTAMIVPQCSHTYCSLCIRRFIAYKNQCPTCTEPVSEPLLRNNRLMDEIIHQFSTVRKRLLKIVGGLDIEVPGLKNEKNSKSTRSSVSVTKDHGIIISNPAEKRENSCAPPDDASDDLEITHIERTPNLTLSSRAPRESPARAVATVRSTPRKPDGSNCVSDKTLCDTGLMSPPRCMMSPTNNSLMSTPGAACSSPSLKNTNKVPCPVCGVEVSDRNINLHLDRCLNAEDKKESLRSSLPKRKPLPKFVYSLMKDKELKKKLTEHGLPTTGDRQALIKRHSEFTLQYNAQCDSLEPKSVQDIVKDVLASNKNKLQMASPSLDRSVQGLQIQKGATPSHVEKAQKEYVKKHRSQFSMLIAEARKKMKKKTEPAAVTESVSESTNTQNADLCTERFTERLTERKAPGCAGDSNHDNEIDTDGRPSQSEACTLPDACPTATNHSVEVLDLPALDRMHSAPHETQGFRVMSGAGSGSEHRVGEGLGDTTPSDHVGLYTNHSDQVHHSELSMKDSGKVIENSPSTNPALDTQKPSPQITHQENDWINVPGGYPMKQRPRHRMVLLDSYDEEPEDSTCSPSLYSDAGSLPPSGSSTVPYSEALGCLSDTDATSDIHPYQVARLREVTASGDDTSCSGAAWSAKGDPLADPVCGVDAIAGAAVATDGHIPCAEGHPGIRPSPKKSNCEAALESAKDLNHVPGMEEGMFSPESPVFDQSHSRKRKRVNLITPPIRPLVTDHSTNQANVLTDRNVDIPCGNGDGNVGVAPPAKKRGRRKKEVLVDMDALIEAYNDGMSEKSPVRVTRSRTKKEPAKLQDTG